MVRYEVSPATFALLRQAQLALAEEHGRHLDDDQLVAALCTAVLDGPAQHERTGRARFQIATIVCAQCDQGWHEAAGVQVPIDAATVARARCDAQHLGSLEADRPERAYQDVPPAVVRFVWRRDHGRCQTPGCRSARGLEIHHIRARADGGTHDPSNLTLRCSSACHAAHHAGTLTIRGTAPGKLETRRRHDHAAPVGTFAAVRAHGGAPKPSEAVVRAQARAPVGTAKLNHAMVRAQARTLVGSPNLDEPVMRAQAREALVGLGWKPGIARAAVDAACAHGSTGVAIEDMIRDALRRCPRLTG